MPSTVLVFAPHPDDAEYYAGGTIACFTREGSRVLIVIATDGRSGSFVHPSSALVPLRIAEAQRGAQILGAEPPLLLGHPDLELDKLPAGWLREEFIRLIRRHRPQAAIAPDPFVPYEPHPDHRQVAWAATEALHYAHLPLVYPEHLLQGLQPHFVIEKFYYGDYPPETPLQPLATLDGIEKRGFCHVVVDVSNTIEVKLAALAEHRSQMSFLVEEMLRQAASVHPAGPVLQEAMSRASADPAAAMARFLRAQAAGIGQRTGVNYGEAFRYERYHPVIESLLSAKEAP